MLYVRIYLSTSYHRLTRANTPDSVSFRRFFALFALACASKPASQKAKITRKYIAGRCETVLSEQKCVQTRKGPQRILAVLSRDLTQYGRISARQNRVCLCQSMVWCMKFSALGMISVGQSFRRRYSDRCPRALCKSDQERVQILNKYIVNGGRPLYGEVTISGAKNAAVAIIPAALMVDGVCRIENIPQISDVTLFFSILDELGAKVRILNRHAVELDCRAIRSTRPSYELARRIRASYYLLGALLGRFGEATVAMPGGCDFGVRPIDQHIKGFTAMGAEVSVESGYINAKAKNGHLRGANIYLDVVSVGATMNIMMAAALAEGTTVIENAAREPHIVDLANFLNSMGADIKGAGTDSIKIRGVKRLNGGSYAIIPDQIEAGTYMAAVAAAGGELLIRNVIPKHMDCISAKLMEMGVEIEENGDEMLIRRNGRLQRTNVKTMPYPGFPTDMQPQIASVLALADGTSLITESVWNNRFKYVDELKRLGARIQVDGKVAVLEGVDHFTGAPVQAPDLRAGAALVIAALAAHGTTEISHVQYIERGYEDIVGKLRAVGADISMVDEPETEKDEARIG